MNAVPQRFEQPPCEGCRFAARCGAEWLACAAYGMYVAREPRRRWVNAPRAPTHARFLALTERRM